MPEAPITLRDAQAALDAACDQTIAAHHAWSDERSGDSDTRRAAPAPPPVLIEVGTGVGKTSRAVPRLAAHVPTLTLVATRELAGDVHTKLMKNRTAARIHFGRHAPAASETASSPYVCLEADSTARPLGAQNHPVMSTGCRTCIYGFAAQQSIYLERDNLDKAAVLEQRIDQARADRAIAPDDPIAPCGYILAVHDELHATHLIGCASSFSRQMADFQAAPGCPREDRLVIIDESCELVNQLIVTPADIAQWREAAHNEIARLRRHPPEREDAAASARLGALEQIAPLLQSIAVKLAGVRVHVCQPSKALVSAIRRLFDLAAPLLNGDTAPWETPELSWADYGHRIPLRAIKALGWAAQWGALSVEQSTLHAAAPTMLLDAILAGDVHAVILDATPDPTILAVVEALGGTIHRAVPDQPLDITWYTARSHGRAATTARTDRLVREVEGLRAVRSAMAADTDQPPAVIGHAPIIRALDDQHGAPAGWWGADERGHDRFADRDLLIDGIPMRSPGVWRRGWLTHRAVLSYAGGQRPPPWSDEREPVAVEITPGVTATSTMAFSSDPMICAWQLAVLGADTIQGLGRVRAIHHPGHRAVILGQAVPIGAGGYHKVTVIGDADPAGMPQTAATYHQGRACGTTIRLLTGAIALHDAGSVPSRRSINCWLRDVAGTIGVSPKSYQQWYARYGAMSGDELRAVVAEITSRAADLVQRGAHIVGVELLEHHREDHGGDCHCTLRAVGELLGAAEPATSPVGLRAGPMAA